MRFDSVLQRKEEKAAMVLLFRVIYSIRLIRREIATFAYEVIVETMIPDVIYTYFYSLLIFRQVAVFLPSGIIHLREDFVSRIPIHS